MAVIAWKYGLKYSVKSHWMLFYFSSTILKAFRVVCSELLLAMLSRFGMEGIFLRVSIAVTPPPLMNEVIVSFFHERIVIHREQIEIMTWV